jgi:flavin reductase (DIM6/NTAB) family NADH-FMN oxidoreductase RutF
MNITKEQLENFEKLYRTAFVNSLAGFRQAVLVGTISKEGKSNLAIFNSLIHLGANPALFGLMSRPDSVPRDTLQNILDTGTYSLNFVHHSYVEKAHQTSARYQESEFNAVGFKEEYLTDNKVPLVSEALVKIVMKFEEKIDIKINGTVMIIGSIQEVILDEQMIDKGGFIDLSSAGVLVSSGLDAYFKTESIGRFSYAKSDKWPSRIDS